MLIAFNKPFNVLCQFTDGAGRRTLADFVTVKGVYPAGRLDYDSEGLVLLTDDGQLQKRIADPRHKMKKTYVAQVERIPDEAALARLRRGIRLSSARSIPSPHAPLPREEGKVRRQMARQPFTGYSMDGMTAPAGARLVDEPDWLWPRVPPIRHRASIPTAWIEMTLTEGRNRQVRRMTAAVNHPTLRLIRTSIGQWSLDGLRPGEWKARR